MTVGVPAEFVCMLSIDIGNSENTEIQWLLQKAQLYFPVLRLDSDQQPVLFISLRRLSSSEVEEPNCEDNLIVDCHKSIQNSYR